MLCNAIGTDVEKIVFLRYAFALMDAPNASQFETYSEEFENWMKKSKSRERALENWYKFWYNSKALWSSAFANQNLTETNLIEAIQSKYSKKNALKNLSLEQSVIFGVADALLYQSRLLETARGRYSGHGPTKHMLESRENEKMMSRVKNTAFTEEDLIDVMKNLGLPTKETVLDEDQVEDYSYKNSPIVDEIMKRRKVIENYTSSPKSTSNFKGTKSPKKKQIQNYTPNKPGRPKGSRTKLNFSPFMKTFEIDDIEEDNDEEGPVAPKSKKKKVKSYLDSLDFDDEFETTTEKQTAKPKKNKPTKNVTQSKTKVHLENMKKRAKAEIHNYEIENIYRNTFKITKTNISQGRTSARITGRFQNHYLVELEEKVVTCSCRAYVEIISKMQDRICKHIAMVLIECKHEKESNYGGNRFLSNEDFDLLMTLIKTHPTRTTQPDTFDNVSPPQVKKPPTKFNRGEFSSYDAAINAAAENEWWVEVYNNGGGPKCRTCGSKIVKNTLCITSDVIGTRPDPDRKTRNLFLALNTFRFCLNSYCALNVPPPQKKMKRFCSMKTLSCAYIHDRYYVDIVKMFDSTNVKIIK